MRESVKSVVFIKNDHIRYQCYYFDFVFAQKIQIKTSTKKIKKNLRCHLVSISIYLVLCHGFFLWCCFFYSANCALVLFFISKFFFSFWQIEMHVNLRSFHQFEFLEEKQNRMTKNFCVNNIGLGMAINVTPARPAAWCFEAYLHFTHSSFFLCFDSNEMKLHCLHWSGFGSVWSRCPSRRINNYTINDINNQLTGEYTKTQCALFVCKWTEYIVI